MISSKMQMVMDPMTIIWNPGKCFWSPNYTFRKTTNPEINYHACNHIKHLLVNTHINTNHKSPLPNSLTPNSTRSWKLVPCPNILLILSHFAQGKLVPNHCKYSSLFLCFSSSSALEVGFFLSFGGGGCVVQSINVSSKSHLRCYPTGRGSSTNNHLLCRSHYWTISPQT